MVIMPGCLCCGYPCNGAMWRWLQAGNYYPGATVDIELEIQCEQTAGSLVRSEHEYYEHPINGFTENTTVWTLAYSVPICGKTKFRLTWSGTDSYLRGKYAGVPEIGPLIMAQVGRGLEYISGIWYDTGWTFDLRLEALTWTLFTPGSSSGSVQSEVQYDDFLWSDYGRDTGYPSRVPGAFVRCSRTSPEKFTSVHGGIVANNLWNRYGSSGIYNATEFAFGGRIYQPVSFPSDGSAQDLAYSRPTAVTQTAGTLFPLTITMRHGQGDYGSSIGSFMPSSYNIPIYKDVTFTPTNMTPLSTIKRPGWEFYESQNRRLADWESFKTPDVTVIVHDIYIDDQPLTGMYGGSDLPAISFVYPSGYSVDPRHEYMRPYYVS